MENKYVQPKTCSADFRYYIKVGRSDSEVIYQRVRFLSYRPHPGEVLIDDGEKIRVISRSTLYIKVSADGEHGNGSTNGGAR